MQRTLIVLGLSVSTLGCFTPDSESSDGTTIADGNDGPSTSAQSMTDEGGPGSTGSADGSTATSPQTGTDDGTEGTDTEGTDSADSSGNEATDTAGTPLPCAAGEYAVGAEVLWGDTTIAFCINGTGETTPATEAEAEQLCSLPDWGLCSAQDVRDRNDNCDYTALTFYGVVAAGGNNCVVASTADEPNTFDCASDFTRAAAPGGCGGMESKAEHSLHEWTEPSGSGFGGAICCLK